MHAQKTKGDFLVTFLGQKVLESGYLRFTNPVFFSFFIGKAVKIFISDGKKEGIFNKYSRNLASIFERNALPEQKAIRENGKG